MELVCYSQRLLNPFRGVQRVIRYGPAEAVTMDGVHWDLYVSNDELLEGLDQTHPVLVSDIRFGRWSADKGLKRGPLYPSADFRRMERMGWVVYEALVELHDQPVFPFLDQFERWLLDESGTPLALLASAPVPEEIEWDLPLKWQSGVAARTGFHSRVCDEPSIRLDQYINGLSGPKPAAVWLKREADGSGQALDGINQPLARTGRSWGAEDFPIYFLGEKGHSPDHWQLIQDFHAWQAPCLLLLPNLPDSRRRWLERRAGNQAEAVDKLFRLYPDDVDQGMVQAARVEAMLRRSQTTTARQEEAMSTFYIELDQVAPGAD